ncbi:MAG: ABC transporter permease [Deltaproteobacteria bacterium]|nr:ABC transporter permease [Deltaproteobacteria bacterium]
MLNQILALITKDLKIFFKDPGALTLIILQPLMFILIMSYAMGGLFGTDRPIRILAVNQDRGKEAAAVIRDLALKKGFQVEMTWEGRPIDRQTAEHLIREGKFSLALVFPAEFSSVLEQGPAMRNGRKTQVLFIVDPAAPAQFVEPVAGTLQGILEKAAFTALMPKGIDYMFDLLSPRSPLSEREAMKSRIGERTSGGLLGGATPVVSVERAAPAGMRAEKKPDSVQQNVPGYTIYGLFWIVSLLAGSILREKRDGTFRRLLAMPVNRGVLLAGKLASHYLINLIQLAVIFLVALLLMGMDFGHSPGGLILISLATAAAATGLGVLVAALARTEAQAGGLTVLLLLTLSGIGGCFVPRFVMPPLFRTIGLATPHAWALDAYQDLLVRGYGVAAVLPATAVLLGFAALFFFIGLWRFQFE